MRRALALVLVLSCLALVAAACGSGGGPAPRPSATPSVEAPPPTAGESSLADLVERLRPSVVRILSEAATLDVFGQVVPSRGVGTGFIIDSDGHIVTNNHVVTLDGDRAAEQITVTLSDGRQLRAALVGRDPPTDVAVLKVDAPDLRPIELGDSARLRVGDDVVAIGNALDLPGGPTVTRGVVSALGRLIQEGGISIPDAVQTDAAINPGNSGGPLIDLQGRVVGITTAIIGGAEGIGLAISIDSAKPIVEELMADGRVDRGYLGITIVEITPSLAERFDLPVERGVGLREVRGGGPADRAGLRPGDIIVRLAGIDIQTSGDLFRALIEHRAGETVSIDFYHGGERETAELTIG